MYIKYNIGKIYKMYVTNDAYTVNMLDKICKLFCKILIINKQIDNK